MIKILIKRFFCIPIKTKVNLEDVLIMIYQLVIGGVVFWWVSDLFLI